ncbi:MAG TPA: cytochrome d ubiquinol oxidase subunit II [Gammaproteobacteria bacterium]|nr:cytochrome d ubiquinol oxidase subunit II [Gammaproteobacteria bacterium]
MGWDLPLVLGLIIAFGVAMYVILDGFDLGVGILFLFAPHDADRDLMMNSLAPIWDGNETWLVLGGTLLIGAFPVAYATVLPALYVPIVVMLFALIFRGIAFEFRFRAFKRRRLWDVAFSGGSTLAAFCQGLSLGAFIDGFTVRNGAFAGHTFDFLSSFAVVCGFGLVAGYSLLGATWVLHKTPDATSEFGRRCVRPTLALTLIFIAVVSVWTPVAHAYISARWFSFPNIVILWPVPVVTALLGYAIWRSSLRHDVRPFVLSIALFLLAYLGLGISLWPYAVPYTITLWQAASSRPTLVFLAVGVGVILPFILAYLAYAHWVFRGKTMPGTGYGEH